MSTSFRDQVLLEHAATPGTLSSMRLEPGHPFPPIASDESPGDIGIILHTLRTMSMEDRCRYLESVRLNVIARDGDLMHSVQELAALMLLALDTKIIEPDMQEELLMVVTLIRTYVTQVGIGEADEVMVLLDKLAALYPDSMRFAGIRRSVLELLQQGTMEA